MLLSEGQGIFSRIDHTLGHKSSLSKLKKKKEIISSIVSDQNATKPKINKKKAAKNTNTQRLNNMLLNKQWITEEIKEKIKKYLEVNDNKDTTIQNLWEACILRRKFSSSIYI